MTKFEHEVELEVSAAALRAAMGSSQGSEHDPPQKRYKVDMSAVRIYEVCADPQADLHREKHRSPPEKTHRSFISMRKFEGGSGESIANSSEATKRGLNGTFKALEQYAKKAPLKDLNLYVAGDVANY
ncbi:hypothetical protein R1sor_026442 [Riccia sorocarpa]|uniref:Uncharacterized protein n=1 Tax=Riccia sorocarpa TaxID=122646 RepID=A0ABD3GFH2_9MARC